MNDRGDLLKQIAAAAITLAVIGIQWYAFDKGAQMEVRARIARAKALLRGILEAERDGERLAEWFVHQEATATIAEAERITREEADAER